MRAIARRVRNLEEQFGTADGSSRFYWWFAGQRSWSAQPKRRKKIMRSLVTRLKRLEHVRAAERRPHPEYTGEHHVVTVGRHSDGKYQWEERPGLAPTKTIATRARS